MPLEEKVPGWELQAKDFIPVYGMLKYQRRAWKYILQDRPPETATEELKYSAHHLPRRLLLMTYHIGTVMGTAYLLEKLLQ